MPLTDTACKNTKAPEGRTFDCLADEFADTSTSLRELDALARA